MINPPTVSHYICTTELHKSKIAVIKQSHQLTNSPSPSSGLLGHLAERRVEAVDVVALLTRIT